MNPCFSVQSGRRAGRAERRAGCGEAEPGAELARAQGAGWLARRAGGKAYCVSCVDVLPDRERAASGARWRSAGPAVATGRVRAGAGRGHKKRSVSRAGRNAGRARRAAEFGAPCAACVASRLAARKRARRNSGRRVAVVPARRGRSPAGLTNGKEPVLTEYRPLRQSDLTRASSPASSGGSG